MNSLKIFILCIFFAFSFSIIAQNSPLWNVPINGHDNYILANIDCLGESFYPSFESLDLILDSCDKVLFYSTYAPPNVRNIIKNRTGFDNKIRKQFNKNDIRQINSHLYLGDDIYKAYSSEIVYMLGNAFYKRRCTFFKEENTYQNISSYVSQKTYKMGKPFECIDIGNPIMEDFFYGKENIGQEFNISDSDWRRDKKRIRHHLEGLKLNVNIEEERKWLEQIFYSEYDFTKPCCESCSINSNVNSEIVKDIEQQCQDQSCLIVIDKRALDSQCGLIMELTKNGYETFGVKM